MKLSSYWLRRWSESVRERDDHVCYVCGERKEDNCDAHHVYPKCKYPEKAYDLTNGVTVCRDCHQPLVHTSEKSWRKWTDFFKRYLRKKAIKQFNALNNDKIKKSGRK